MNRIPKSEEGASLILVVIFVMIFSLVIAAILDFASTGFESTEEVVAIRNTQHAVDGAMDGAINAVRRSTAFGAKNSPVPCPQYDYDAPSGEPDVTVTCVADTSIGTGAPGEQIPKYAILTGLWGKPASDPNLASDCQGFIMTGGTDMAVDGGIFSNNRIAINDFGTGKGDCGTLSGQGRMLVFGDALAYGECSWWSNNPNPGPQIVHPAGGRLGCQNTGIRPTAREAIPAYEPHYASVAAVAAAGSGFDPKPTCNPVGVDVDAAFEPGVYTELPSYHFSQAGCSASDPNRGPVYWFKPGTYYFDFPAADARSHWDLGGTKTNIVGGTLKNPAAVRSTWNSSSEHKYCQDDPATTSPGVQFIFGGRARMTARSDNNGKGGVINICGGANPDGAVKQRVVVYALQPKHDATPTVVAANPDVCPTTRVDCLENKTTLGVGGSFLLPPNAKSPDAFSATRAFTFGDAAANVTFDDFADIPNGSAVSSIKAEIRHSETGSTDGLEKTITFSYKNLAGITTALSPITVGSGACTQSTVSGDTVDLCTIPLPDPFLWSEINSLTATYTVNPRGLTNPNCPGSLPGKCPQTATASLNSVLLKVGYETPAFEDAATKVSCSCNLLTTTNNPQTYFEGTFFAPYQNLAINVHNGGTTEFARGVIASHIEGQASSSSKQDSAPFKLPGLDNRRVVVFTATVNGKPRLRARAAFDDLTGQPGKTVEILDWQVIRG